MRKCDFCGEPALTFWQLICLGFGLRVRCKNCDSVMSSHEMYHFVLSVFLVLLTLFLLVWLGNLYGIYGIVLAFVIPFVLEIFSVYWIPVSIAHEGRAERKRRQCL